MVLLEKFPRGDRVNLKPSQQRHGEEQEVSRLEMMQFNKRGDTPLMQSTLDIHLLFCDEESHP